MTSPEDVLTFLKPRLTGAMRPEEIATLMAPLASGSAWAYLGGSGARQQIFRLSGNLRAVFQFGVAEKLIAYGAYCSVEPWEKELVEPVSPVSGLSISLILLAKEGN